ncbi:MAG: 2-succinyl-6-hydroxy-2,4-cyclohexadiene-1-carboxylate synthase [Balneolaceae bacterium]|nr:2-succinyl-6-hydroxy-2,4-cyclohexadiene-1-carboxylate synthase [Balneolaceae bacterium]
MRITSHGISYHVRRHRHDPSLPSLLLLHGFMGSGRAFSHLVDSLTPFSNPITIDLLGHGKTEGTTDPGRYAVDQQIRDLDHIIREMNTGSLFLHGYSMGGRLALRYALSHPDAIDGLVLESTTIGIADCAKREARIREDEERASAILNNYKSFLSSWHKQPLFSSNGNMDSALEQHYRQLQQSQNPEYMAASLRGFGTGQMPPVGEELSRLVIPTLLMAGEHDKKYRTIMNRMDQQLPESRSHIIRDAGHRIHLEHPRAFLDHLKAFVLCSSRNICL